MLEPAPAEFPPALTPEEWVPCATPFDNGEWRFSVDWDGMRGLLMVGTSGEARLVDERMRDAGARFPEILAAASSLSGRAAVLDGVVAVLDAEGRPDLPALCARLMPGSPPRAEPAAVYLATDLLHLDGVSLMSWPLDRRHQALAALLAPQARLQVPGWVSGHGRAFCEAAAERNLPAVLARRGDAPYRPAVASPDRLRIAVEERSDAVVVGVTVDAYAVPRIRRRTLQITALRLGEHVDGRMVGAGRAAAAWTPAVEAWLRSEVERLRVDATPIEPELSPDEKVIWLRPSVVATVRHHGRDSLGRLRMPSLVALRQDRDPAWCVRRAPVPPPAETPVQGAFRPTVLHTLPFDS